jgi:hypothetical protein
VSGRFEPIADEQKMIIMEKEKWLKKLLFDSGLLYMVALSENEILSIKQELRGKETLQEPEEDEELESEYRKAAVERGFRKISATLRKIISLNKYVADVTKQNQILRDELVALRNRFRKELADEEAQKEYERLNLPISQVTFSTRARYVFSYHEIKTLNDLRSLSIEEIEICRNTGRKTSVEIETTARDFGIEIPLKRRR